MNKIDEFKIKELCWAKIKGFPWWPALIREIKYSNNEKYYNIGYICESKGSDLDGSKIKKWKENYESFKQGWTLPKDKKSLKQNDFECSLAMADKLFSKQISPEDHDEFILKYKTKKERHSLYNINEFLTEIEKEKRINDENKSENVKETKENKNEDFEMSKKDLNKTDALVKNITSNLDEIIIKTEKYQKFFEKECKDKNISYLDDKNLKTKIELVKYIQIMNDVYDTPIKMERELDNNLMMKEKEKVKEIV